jgi:RHS repeat-associated protein
MVAWTFDNRSTDLSGTANDPTHDAAGNMTADENNNYIYDAWNRLAEVRDRATDALIATYEYDGQKRRIEKTVDSTTEDIFYNSEWQILEVRTADDTDPSEQYIWDIRYVDAPVLRFQDTNNDGTVDNTLYYTNDANFNVTSLVDESGNMVERYAYSPYGERTVLDADWSADADGVSDVNNALGHQGLHLDTESTLYYNRNRYYSPTLGRFTTRDPLGYVDGMSVYEYVASTPIRAYDPSGLACYVCDARLVTSGDIAALDADYEGTPHKEIANEWRRTHEAGLAEMAKQNNHLVGWDLPEYAQAGPHKVTNGMPPLPGFLQNQQGNRVSAGYFAWTYFLFFVQVDICEDTPGDCAWTVSEHLAEDEIDPTTGRVAAHRSAGGSEINKEDRDKYSRRAARTTPKRSASGKRCGLSIIFGDAPGTVHVVDPAVAAQLFRLRVSQGFYVWDKASGSKEWNTLYMSYQVKVGLNKNKNLVHS